MRLSLTPMLTLGLECPECNQLLDKLPQQATSKEIIEVRQAIGSVNDPVQDRVKKRCSKCGSEYFPE